MEIERINNNLYDQRGGFQQPIRTRKFIKKTSARQIIDAVSFESFKPVHPELQQKQELQFLASYVNSLSDEEVNRRMRDYKNSFDEIDNAIIEKLIMEAL
jgi:predicted CopG family antitoxin